jgi:hypothetical protein
MAMDFDVMGVAPMQPLADVVDAIVRRTARLGYVTAPGPGSRAELDDERGVLDEVWPEERCEVAAHGLDERTRATLSSWQGLSFELYRPDGLGSCYVLIAEVARGDARWLNVVVNMDVRAVERVAGAQRLDELLVFLAELADAAHLSLAIGRVDMGWQPRSLDDLRGALADDAPWPPSLVLVADGLSLETDARRPLVCRLAGHTAFLEPGWPLTPAQTSLAEAAAAR